ncbi:MAG: tetratricopeptide repeat protein, partial [Thermoguttaceae bacterium]
MRPRGLWLSAAMIVGVVALIYSNTFSVPFLFDDNPSIGGNQTIQQLWPIGPLLDPPCHGEAVQRRPVVNVSLAINYAISKTEPWSYHAFNLVAHLSAALLLLGIVRRTLLRIPGNPNTPQRDLDHLAKNSLLLATLVALIWAVHPLLTEAVTYTIQRTEVLAGLFYLLALYCVLRGSSSRHPLPWYTAAAVSCALAIGSKEAAISAPLVILLYDRVFLTASWRETFRRRWPLYVAMAASWAIPLVMLRHGHDGAAPFGHGRQALDYLLAQFGVLSHYLRLCYWPCPLVVDYGVYKPQTIGQILPYALLIGTLVIGVILALRRQPWLGFLGVAFFAILAPSSGMVPILQQVAAEKRMYLPLAAVVIATVMSVYALGRRLLDRRWPQSEDQPAYVRRLQAGLLGAMLVLLGSMTYIRNHDYRAAITLWEDTVRKCPENARAQNNLGFAYESIGLVEDAVICYRDALKLNIQPPTPHRNLGRALVKCGDVKEGLALLKKAVAFAPNDASAQADLGAALLSLGRAEDALPHLQKAVTLDPRSPDPHNNLGALLMRRGQFDQAIAQFRRALDLRPQFFEAQVNLQKA